jgi:hypothetical protein
MKNLRFSDITPQVPRYFAQAISVICHPLLMVTYMLLLLLLVNPYLFGVNNVAESKVLIARVFASSFFLPAIAIFLMQRLGMIQSLEMHDKQERIGPFIATGIFYIWVFLSVKNDNNMPTAFLIAVLGATIGLFACFLINLFFKISLHATGIGGFIGMVLITMWLYSFGMIPMNVPFLGASNVSINLVLIISIVLAGLVGSARLLLGAHHPRELYAGFALGLFAQYVALKILI